MDLFGNTLFGNEQSNDEQSSNDQKSNDLLSNNLFNNDINPWEYDDKRQTPVAEIVFSQPPFGPYSYAIPDQLVDQVEPGMRVKVPLGTKRTVVGWVTAVEQKVLDEKLAARLKPISSLMDTQPLMDSSLLELTDWISQYYLCPRGQVLETAVPAGVKFNAGTKKTLFVIPTPQGEKVSKTSDGKYTDAQGQEQTLSVTQKRALGVVVDHYSDPAAIENNPLTLSDIAGRARCSFGPINELRTKGLLDSVYKRVRSSTESKPELYPDDTNLSGVALTPDQTTALGRIHDALQSRTTRTILLHGVTGSGKTEVYIRSIAETLRFGRQAIVLVPEISLTPQTSQRFKTRFPRVAVLHSHLSDVERNQQWTLIAEGKIDVVVGARSAIFAPLRNLGLIIIDEEHENTFKQETAPRYHARDVAVHRAQYRGIPLVLGSATPSLESWQRVQTGQYELVSMPVRVNNLPMPKVEIVDMCDSSISSQQRGIITRKLFVSIVQALRDKHQVILLLNRRGFNTQIQCPACGGVYKCPSCDIALTFHRNEATAICHYCDYRVEIPDRCPGCGFRGLRFSGFGTQRLESEIQSKFPEARVLRMDTDTMQGPRAHENALAAFRKGEIDILLGTQMIAKGLDFPNVTVVGVLNADTALHLPDFRAAEKTFQLITQVAGRTGRGEYGGQVILQTYQPDNRAILAASQHDFLGFAAAELPERKMFAYPPFAFMARIILRSENEQLAQSEVVKLRNWLETAAEIDLSVPLSQRPIQLKGPAPAPFYKLRDYFRFQLQLQSYERPLLEALLKKALDEYKPDDGVQWIVDMDPLSML